MHAPSKIQSDRLVTARLLPLFLAGLLAASAACAAWTTVRGVKGATRATAVVEGKDRVYWQLEKDGVMSASVNGPAVLRVVTRTPWKSKLKGKESVISWSLDGKEVGLLRGPLVRSRSTRLQPAKDAPEFLMPSKWRWLSASRTDEIQIPYGTHKVEFRADQTAGESVLVRLKHKALNPLPKGGTVDLLPRTPGTTRGINVKEKRATYQVLRSGGELALEVTGPTVVKVISRLDWNTTMAGRQKYQLKVGEDGSLKHTWILHGRHSAVAVYADKNDTTPARGEIVYIDVPAGRHQYTVQFQDSGREVNMRFIMSREALRNGGK